jgi:hypothetical protein
MVTVLQLTVGMTSTDTVRKGEVQELFDGMALALCMNIILPL